MNYCMNSSLSLAFFYLFDKHDFNSSAIMCPRLFCFDDRKNDDNGSKGFEKAGDHAPAPSYICLA